MEIIEFHSTFSRHGNAQASLTLLIWLNEKVQKLRLKINQKLSWRAPDGALYLGECPSGRNLSKSVQNQTEWLLTCGWARGRHASRGNYSKLYSKLIKNYCWCARRRTLSWESLFEREIIQKLNIKINRAARWNWVLECASHRKIVQTEPKEQREQCELAQALPSRVWGRHMSTQSSLLELLRCSLSYVNHSKSKQNQTGDSDSAPKGTLMRSARFAWK